MIVPALTLSTPQTIGSPLSRPLNVRWPEASVNQAGFDATPKIAFLDCGNVTWGSILTDNATLHTNFLDYHFWTISFSASPNPTMHIVAHAATPIRGTTPRKRPRRPDFLTMCLNVESMVADLGRVGSCFMDCISTRRTYCMSSSLSKRTARGEKQTSNGWFQQLNAPPIVDASTFSPIFNLSSSLFPLTERILPSANLEIPILDDHPVTCLNATALTPLLTPRIPFSRIMLINVSIAPGAFSPFVLNFERVTSTVFIHVVIPIVR